MANQQSSAGDTPPVVLIVDDEGSIVDILRRGLKAAGYEVAVALDGPSGLAKARSLLPAIIILDIMLPGVSGLDICRQLRASGPTANVPIIMLTAKDEVRDRVSGLETGADDYVTKPFDIAEMVARVRALLRRQQRMAGDGVPAARILRFQDLTLNESTREVARGERQIELTATEYSLLRLFMLHPRQVLDRQTILDRVWGYDFMGETNIIEVYVRYLREKIEDEASAPRLIQTVRGVGYVLRGS